MMLIKRNIGCARYIPKLELVQFLSIDALQLFCFVKNLIFYLDPMECSSGFTSRWPSKPKYCQPCDMWTNGPEQFADHNNGKRHKNKVNGKKKSSSRSCKGISIPEGTAFLIEQTALWEDAVTDYIRQLYTRVLSRL